MRQSFREQTTHIITMPTDGGASSRNYIVAFCITVSMVIALVICMRSRYLGNFRQYMHGCGTNNPEIKQMKIV